MRFHILSHQFPTKLLQEGCLLSEGYPYRREQAASGIVGDAHKYTFVGNEIAYIVGQGNFGGQRYFAAAGDFQDVDGS